MESVYGNTLDVFGKTLLDLARFEVGNVTRICVCNDCWNGDSPF